MTGPGLRTEAFHACGTPRGEAGISKILSCEHPAAPGFLSLEQWDLSESKVPPPDPSQSANNSLTLRSVRIRLCWYMLVLSCGQHEFGHCVCEI